VFLDDEIAPLGTELGVEFATPTIRLKGRLGQQLEMATLPSYMM
jgi:hypothetical protein